VSSEARLVLTSDRAQVDRRPADAQPIGGRHRPGIPGLGTRFLAGLERDVTGLGWTSAETLGLLAAAEERCGLWVAAPRRLSTAVRVLVWRSGRFVPAAGGLSELKSAAAAAPSGLGLCLVAASGTGDPPRSLLSALQPAAERAGRVADGVAAQLRVPWAVELLIAPALGPAALAGLRERINSAPRCAWCHVPVLGSSCSRCRGGAA
jgi:hypothetical protein